MLNFNFTLCKFVAWTKYMEFSHISVLLSDCIELLNVKKNGIYVDCTLGGGGHSEEILKRLSSDGLLIGIDQDMDAINECKNKFKDYDNVKLVHNNFVNYADILKDLNIEKVDGVILDLGVSSYQLDNEERGFSYSKDSLLDMRMNRENELSAHYIINNYSEEKLTKIFWDYGEERFSRKISSLIVKERETKEINTTKELVEIIKRAIPMKFRAKGHHPAKKVFQAIRIEVNNELGILKSAIEDIVNSLNIEGRVGVITFHSLEDRIIKNVFKELNNPCECPKGAPICVCNKVPLVKILTRKPIEAKDDELEENPRSRSAKLRFAERI